MATLQSQIETAVLRGKCQVSHLTNKLIKQEKSGDNITCCTSGLKLLVRWIEVLENFYCQHYQTSGEDKFQCLTESEAMVLVGKLNKLVGV